LLTYKTKKKEMEKREKKTSHRKKKRARSQVLKFSRIPSPRKAKTP
jgi:hypothetical protein